MQEGVQITGRITEVGSGQPVQSGACALNPLTEIGVGCAPSEPREEGRYSIAGLPLGSYVIGFSIDHKEDGVVLHPDGYVRQYYDGKPSFAEASLVGGSAGVYPGIDAQLVKGPEVFPGESALGTAPTSAETVGLTQAPAQKPKPLSCRRGFAKKKLHGALRCVKDRRDRPKRKHRPGPPR